MAQQGIEVILKLTIKGSEEIEITKHLKNTDLETAKLIELALLEMEKSLIGK